MRTHEPQGPVATRDTQGDAAPHGCAPRTGQRFGAPRRGMAWEGARAIAHPADSLGRNSPKRTRVEHAQPCRPARQPAAPRRTPGGPSARGAPAVPLRSQSRVGEGGGRAEPARTLQTHLGCQQRRYCLTTPESPTRVEQTKLSGPPWTWGQAVVHLTVGGACSRVTHKAVTLRWAQVPCRRPATAGGSSRAPVGCDRQGQCAEPLAIARKQHHDPGGAPRLLCKPCSKAASGTEQLGPGPQRHAAEDRTYCGAWGSSGGSR